MATGRRRFEYPGQAVVVHYDRGRCIHAAECVRGLPAVFDPDRRPWIEPDAAAADAVAEVVGRCPTGALSIERTDGGAVPDAGAPRVAVAPDGPLFLGGSIELVDDEGRVTQRERRAALCRCGASQGKPFCDGSHARVGFRDAAHPTVRRPAERPGERLVVSFSPNGPAIVRGPFAFAAADGEAVGCCERAAFCRCGGSEDKPYCDGSHARLGFRG
jgi:CDGSH-type Zn-finger protein/uncharacterized Fe-S cluster protein YjdI